MALENTATGPPCGELVSSADLSAGHHSSSVAELATVGSATAGATALPSQESANEAGVEVGERQSTTDGQEGNFQNELASSRDVRLTSGPGPSLPPGSDRRHRGAHDHVLRARL